MRQGGTSERREYLCKTQLRSTIETSDSPTPRPPPFQSTPTTPETSHSERSKVYWSWPSLLHAQGQRGNLPWQINGDSGIGILKARKPTIKKQNSRRAVRQRTAKGANHWANQQGSKWINQSCWKPTKHSRAWCFIGSRMASGPHRLKKTSCMQWKRRDLHHMWLHRETNRTFFKLN